MKRTVSLAGILEGLYYSPFLSEVVCLAREPSQGLLVVLNNALAGSLLLVTDCRADGRIRNRQTLNIKSNHRPLKSFHGPSSHREDRGPRGIFLPRTLVTSWHRFVKNQCQGLTLTFLMFHTKFRNGEFFPFHELQSKR